MGNTHVKPHPRLRNKKQVHWKAAARPPQPGKPQLAPDSSGTPDLVTIIWTKPITDGGSPITGYLVEHRRTGSPHWVRATPILVPQTELTISGLEPGWRYQFRVRAENAVGLSDPSELSEPITVTLQRSAITAPRFTQELQETTALENEKAEFAVHFLGQPPPKVCWFKDAYEIFSSRRIRILTESDRSNLTIHQCSLSDEGEIKCTATNRAGHVTTKAKLTIQAPPSIRLPRQYEDGLLFEIGEAIRLKVSVAGRPTPLVFWTHNGDSIKNDDRYEIEYIEKSSVLKINEARREDRGEYQIKAVNKLGEDIQSFLVTVTDKPSPPGKARVIMTLGRSVTLSWSHPSDDGGCKIGNYIVEYYRLGWNVWLKAATSRQLTTMLGDLIEGSEYKFRIKAESPYGVSDPSEETEVIFIPDPKRGILQPPARGRSQPRDIKQELGTPVVARRKKRSQSSNRAENGMTINSNLMNNIEKSAVPKPPERKKIKSPILTPEASPINNRKNPGININKELFDRTSVARDLAYGSPEIKVQKELLPQSNVSSNSEKSRTPSPLMIANKLEDHKVFTVKIEPPHKSPPPREPSPVKALSTSPEIQTRRLSKGHFTGSSEFMLVLYPGENEKGQYDLDSDEDTVPPPMSLSAPELGAEMPEFTKIRNSVSSTELLHERAMMRLYAAAEAEEREVEQRRKSIEKGTHIEIPKIQINSKEEENVLNLEKNQLLQRRLSAGGMSQQQLKVLQKRHSLKSPTEIKNDIMQTKQNKVKQTVEDKRDIFAHRQRSESEEKEELLFEYMRKKGSDSKPSTEKRKITVVDFEKWADDYESSTESENSDESYEDDRREVANTYQSKCSDEEMEEIYRPAQMRNLKKINQMQVTDKDPFEILSVKKDPPSPDFVPKPILKRHELEEPPFKEVIHLPPPPQAKRSRSPIPPKIIQRNRSQSLVEGTFLTQYPPSPSAPKSRSNSPNIVQRDRSQSLVEATFNNQSLLLPISPQLFPVSSSTTQRDRSQSLIEGPQTLPANLITLFEQAQSPSKQRQRSFSLMPQKELLSKKLNINEELKTADTSKQISLHTISEGAKISGITAASVVIPDKLLEQQKAAEETKIVADHYAEIVKNYSKPSNHSHMERRISQTMLSTNDEAGRSQNIFTKKQVEAKVNQKQLENKNENELSPLRSSYVDHYNHTPVKTSMMNQNCSPDRCYSDQSPIRSSFTDHYDTSPRRDSIVSSRQESVSTPRRESLTDNASLRKDSLKSNFFSTSDHLTSVLSSKTESLTSNTFPKQDSLAPSSKIFNSTDATEKSENINNLVYESSKVDNVLGAKNKIISAYNHNPSNLTNVISPYGDYNVGNVSQRRGSLIKSENESQNVKRESNLTQSMSPARSSSRSRTSSNSSSVKTETWEPKSESKIRSSRRKTSPSPMRQEKRSKTLPSPMHQHKPRKTSPSPLRQANKRQASLSPYRYSDYRPMLREIMTQTSGEIVEKDGEYSRTSSPGGRTPQQEELFAQTEVRVRSFVDYLTDLAMFIVACWFYLFSNELYAIPFMLIMVYRQLQTEVAKRIPKWLLRRLKKNSN